MLLPSCYSFSVPSSSPRATTQAKSIFFQALLLHPNKIELRQTENEGRGHIADPERSVSIVLVIAATAVSERKAILT